MHKFRVDEVVFGWIGLLWDHGFVDSNELLIRYWNILRLQALIMSLAITCLAGLAIYFLPLLTVRIR